MKSTSQVAPMDPADFAPGEIAHDTARKMFEATEAKTVERNRSLLISAGLLLAVVAQSVTIATLLPLKEIQVLQPQMVESGRVVADPTPVGNIKITNAMTGYFLNQWVQSIHEISGVKAVEKSLLNAAAMTVGAAKDQFREWRTKENPFLLLSEAPGLTRDYEYRSLNFQDDGTALIRFSTTTRRPGTPPKVEYFLIAAKLTHIPTTTMEEYMRNPAGLYVTFFTKSEETTPK